MEPEVLVVSVDEWQLREIREILKCEFYNFVDFLSVEELETALGHHQKGVILLDLDDLPVTDRVIRNLTRQHRQFSVLAISSLSYHPSLHESLSTHITACLRKPVDAEELVFWLEAWKKVHMNRSLVPPLT
ncbi:conserved hypothetical protein [delta proteobacterium NaphS2]|nr:conserved hypothetical protein [delta proteobacterium NaphS2]